MHWRNSQFQVLNFLVGKTHTVDEAYRVCKELREERSGALSAAKVQDLRTQAKAASARAVLSVPASESDNLSAQADLLEINSFMEVNQACIDEAKRELDFLDMLLTRLEPHRKYSNYPDHEAHQLCQSEEWCLELMWRAENFISYSGNIPPDQLITMRLHPEFNTKILPYISICLQRRNDGPNTEHASLERPIEAVLLQISSDMKKLN